MKWAQQGLTMIELLIGMIVSLIISAGVLELFLNNHASYRVQNGLALIQENGRYVKHILGNEIRMSGYQGCANQHTLTPNIVAKNLPAGFTFTQDDAVKGYEATSGSAWSPALPSGLSSSVKGGTDVILVRKGAEASVKMVSAMAQANSTLAVANRVTVSAGDVLLITDCDSLDIFKAGTGSSTTAINHGTANNTSANLSKAYGLESTLMHVESTYYYIKDSGRTNSSGETIYSLFQQNISGTEEELVEGIEDLQVSYGVDTTGDGSADSFMTANNVESSSNWPNVMSVKLLVLLNTVENVSGNSVAYTFNGTTVSSPSDRLIRRSWEHYISLRNRSL